MLDHLIHCHYLQQSGFMSSVLMTHTWLILYKKKFWSLRALFQLPLVSLSFPLNSHPTTQLHRYHHTQSLSLSLSGSRSLLNPPRWQWAQSTNKFLHFLHSRLLPQVTCLTQHASTSSKSLIPPKHLNKARENRFCVPIVSRMELEIRAS